MGLRIPGANEMQTHDPPFRPTVIRVLLVEALVVLTLWWVGYYFSA